MRAQGGVGADSVPEVFNTSEPKYRFTDASTGENQSFDPFGMYTDPLSAYLAERVRTADAYLLLATPASLTANSKWIEFEISIAEEIYRRLVAAFNRRNTSLLFYMPR